MEKIKISVITTLYNGSSYLPGLLEMFRRNTALLDAPAEYVLVNDSPWTPVVIEAQGLNVRVLENPENYVSVTEYVKYIDKRYGHGSKEW